MVQKTNLASFDWYIDGVISGKIPCSKWIKKAVERHLADLNANKFEFDWAKAERAINFIQLMPHTKGEWAQKGMKLQLQPWQIFKKACEYGWINPDTGYRRFRESWCYVPRKNGKSAEQGADAIYALTADDEYGAEVYASATSEKQAIEVFQPAWLMCRKTPKLMSKYGIELTGSAKNPTGIYTASGGKFERVIGKPNDGASPSKWIIDEWHEHTTTISYDTGISGMGARRQPMLSGITTAGTSLDSPAYETQLQLQSLLNGDFEEDTTFALLFGIDTEDGDDFWKAPEALIKANPNYGVSVYEDFLRQQQENAINNPNKVSTFKTKHLNIWVDSKQAYLNTEQFRLCGREDFNMDIFHNPTIITIDLSQTRDFACWDASTLVDGVHYSKTFYYLPEFTVNLVPEHLSKRYKQWAKRGHLKLTAGEIVDYNVIMADVMEFMNTYKVYKVRYDTYNAHYIMNALSLSRIDHKGFGRDEIKDKDGNKINNSLNRIMNQGMKELDAKVSQKSLVTDANPVTNWMAGNLIDKSPKSGNVFPGKPSKNAKIDGMITLIASISILMDDKLMIKPKRKLSADSFLIM